jgi:hypothetical protein
LEAPDPVSSKCSLSRTSMVTGRSPDGRPHPREKIVNVDQWPDCLGCSDEPSRQQAVFPKTLDGETRTESPVGLYSDPARWCERCWILWEQFDRFHLLYSRRLRTYTRTLLIHLPPRSA